jgi:uncharacterized membrane protein YozB (DUF420 family)
MFRERQDRKVGSEPLAMAILVVTIFGVALSFLKSRKSSLIASLIGIVDFILLLLLKSKIETEATNQGQGIIQVEYGIGFWLVLILFIAAIALNGYLYFGSKQQTKVTTLQT